MVETNLGRVSVTDSNIHNNAGNGIKAKFLDGRWPFFNKDRTFCTLPNLGAGLYPLIMVGIPTEIRNYCNRVSFVMLVLCTNNTIKQLFLILLYQCYMEHAIIKMYFSTETQSV